LSTLSRKAKRYSKDCYSSGIRKEGGGREKKERTDRECFVLLTGHSEGKGGGGGGKRLRSPGREKEKTARSFLYMTP